jgi:excisionase family DNA binding protein
MFRDQAGVRADIRLARTKVDNALITCRVAASAATEAAAALERIEASLAAQQPVPAAAPAALQAYCRVAEAARVLSVSQRTIWRRIEAGEFRVRKDGRCLLIETSSLFKR